MWLDGHGASWILPMVPSLWFSHCCCSWNTVDMFEFCLPDRLLVVTYLLRYLPPALLSNFSSEFCNPRIGNLVVPSCAFQSLCIRVSFVHWSPLLLPASNSHFSSLGWKQWLEIAFMCFLIVSCCSRTTGSCFVSNWSREIVGNESRGIKHEIIVDLDMKFENYEKLFRALSVSDSVTS